MKKILFVLGMVLVIAGCKPENAEEQSTTHDATTKQEAARNVTPGKPAGPSKASPAPEVETSIENIVWKLVKIGRDSVVPNSQVTLHMEDGAVSGRGGCNSYKTTYTLSAKTVSFGPVAGTRMACAEEALGKQEQEYFTLLSKSSNYDRLPDGQLIIINPERRTLFFVEDK